MCKLRKPTVAKFQAIIIVAVTFIIIITSKVVKTERKSMVTFHVTEDTLVTYETWKQIRIDYMKLQVSIYVRQRRQRAYIQHTPTLQLL